jgi:hypothetical protein
MKLIVKKYTIQQTKKEAQPQYRASGGRFGLGDDGP